MKRAVSAGLLCMLIAVFGVACQVEAGQVWSLADDFTLAENSDTSTWSYRLEHTPTGQYDTLLDTTTRNANVLWATSFANPPLMWSEPWEYWGIGKNTTGTTQTSGDIEWAPNEILLHPRYWADQNVAPQRMVISWLAPSDLAVDVDYSFGSAMAFGNGTGYRIVHRSAAGDVAMPDFTYIGGGSVTDSIGALSVAEGDRLFFAFDAWGNADGDVVRAAITIEEALPPEPLALPFVEDFNGFTAPGANFNGGQAGSGLAVAHSGDVPDWSKSGDGAVHVVDHANVYPDIINPRDFAPMIWGATPAQGPANANVITLDDTIDANAAGQTYTVDFVAGPAIYQGENDYLHPASQGTAEDDGILIEVLRGDGSVLDDYIHDPGVWAGSTTLLPDSFTYVGDGTGPVRIRIGPSNPNSGNFGGAIDNLSIVPEPSSGALVLLGLVGLGLFGRRHKRA